MNKPVSLSCGHSACKDCMFIYLFIYLLFSHNKDYTSITLYKDVARGPQKTTRLVRGGPLVTIILSNRTITTHNNGQYKTHYRYSRKSKTFVLNDVTVSEESRTFKKLLALPGYDQSNPVQHLSSSAGNHCQDQGAMHCSGMFLEW